MWTKKCMEYNRTTLGHVFGQYYRKYSAGDIGSKDFLPTPGHERK
jgi:hypothetical protein